MGWEELKDQVAAVRLLRGGLMHGRVTHAYLFFGPDAQAKERAARLLAQALNCEQSPGEPCGTCRSCHLIAAGTHPDVRVLAPSGRYIRLDEVREFCRAAHASPLLGRVKVLLIEEADRMLPEAASHLLKTLEEPPPDTFFVLTAAQPYALLPTIRSRLQPVPFRAPAPEATAGELKEQGCDPVLAHRAAYLAAGDPQEAAAWLGPEGRRSLDEFLELAPELPAGKGALFRAAEVCAAEPARFLTLLSAWYRDLTFWRCGHPELLYFRGAEEVLGRVAGNYSRKDLVRINAAIQRTARLVLGRTNVNVRLAFEALLVELVAKREPVRPGP